jgi:hypothetical protein
MLVSLNGPTLWLPAVGLLPNHAPPALHEVALVVDQVNVEEPLALTVVGLAVRVMVGRVGGATLTVTERVALPPAPVQVKKNVLVVVNELRGSLPDSALVPDQAPEAVHEVASLEVQLNVAEPS